MEISKNISLWLLILTFLILHAKASNNELLKCNPLNEDGSTQSTSYDEIIKLAPTSEEGLPNGSYCIATVGGGGSQFIYKNTSGGTMSKSIAYDINKFTVVTVEGGNRGIVVFNADSTLRDFTKATKEIHYPYSDIAYKIASTGNPEATLINSCSGEGGSGSGIDGAYISANQHTEIVSSASSSIKCVQRDSGATPDGLPSCTYYSSTKTCTLDYIAASDSYCIDDKNNAGIIYKITSKIGIKDIVNGVGTATCEETYANSGAFLFTKGDSLIPSADVQLEGTRNGYLYLCTESKCTKSTPSKTSYYLNKGEKASVIYCTYTSTTDIKCNKYTHSYSSPVYYLNSQITTTTTKNGVIRCTNLECTIEPTPSGYYINAAVASTNINAIISCTEESCKIITGPSNGTYLIHGGISSLNYAIIKCDIGCTLVAGNEGYYLKGYSTGYDDALILLNSDNKYYAKSAIDTGNYYSADGGIIICSSSTCKLETNPSMGYYINAGDDKVSHLLIFCGADKKCKTNIINPGYYLTSGVNPSVIECDLTYCFIVSESKRCSGELLKNGNYCMESSKLYFAFNATTNAVDMLTSTNLNILTNISNDEVAAQYRYVSVDSFPSSSTPMTTLFRITQLSISMVVFDGSIIVNTSGVKVNIIGTTSFGNENTLYSCNSSSRICNSNIRACSAKIYIFDYMHEKVLLCENSSLTDVNSAGYYVDGNRTSGQNTPYVLPCTTASKCSSLKSKEAYFVNNGYDKSTNALIYCDGSTCNTVAATAGYYVGENNDSVIYCSSVTSCTSVVITGTYNFINNGIDKTHKKIIRCSDNRCFTTVASVGYYVTNKSAYLINCETSSICTEVSASVGYYDSAEDSSYVIHCEMNVSIYCTKELSITGYYVSTISNVLINCMYSGKCRTIIAKNGIYRSATKTTVSKTRDLNEDEKDIVAKDEKSKDGKSRSNVSTVYNLISCNASSCSELNSNELAAIPVCSFTNNKCYITAQYALSNSATSTIAAGGYCTNDDRSKLYFATDTVVIEPSVIAGTTATYTYTTTTSNCLEVSEQYNTFYYTVSHNIYHLDEGQISQVVASGYYFINVITNVLATSTKIDDYNDSNIKLYKCNDNTCTIIDKPDSITYYADVNKRIVKYNVNSNSYTFPYEKDVVCIYSNNKCTPNADLKNKEFCITYKGELVLAATDILSREKGDCYKGGNISSSIYGYSQFLYEMDIFSAQMIDTTAYYTISLSTNSTAQFKDYSSTTSAINIYGCITSTCKIIEPKKDVYYYDHVSSFLFKYDGEEWTSPEVSGYALISPNPNEEYIYKFTTVLNKVTLIERVEYGYYYTVDEEMYECNDENASCKKITDNDYYFTNNGELFYCIYDSENKERTICNKQSCIIGQYYYINDGYYRCDAGYFLNIISSRYCNYSDKLIINFPTVFNEYPDNIKFAVEGVYNNNNSTSITKNGKNYLSVIPGVFTNCTYNAEEKVAKFDMVCINNFVAINEEDGAEICSIHNMGYVECIDDENNPEKCNPSSALSKYSRPILYLFTTLLSIYLFTRNI